MYENISVPPITNMMVAITNQCNLRCPFCFIEKDEKVMPYDTLIKVIDFLYQNSLLTGTTPRMVFFGGEPMTEWDRLVVPAVKYVREKYGFGFTLSMTTNISLLTEERLDFMRTNRLRALYSVDGGADTMAINRPQLGGKSAFDIIDHNISLILQRFPGAPCRMTIYEPTVANYFDDLLYLIGKGFTNISALPNLFETWSDDGITEFARQIHKYGDYLIDEFRAGRTPTVMRQYGECFFQMVKVNRCNASGEFQQMSKCKACGKCGFGLGQHATCDYTGDIYGCLHPAPLTRENIFYLGNIYDGIDAQRTQDLVSMCEYTPVGGMDCAGCKLEAICDRGCAPNNYVITGTMNTPPPMYCHFNRILFDDAERVAVLLGNEENEAFRAAFQSCVRRDVR